MDWKWIIDLIGWIGSLELVFAYFMVSYQKMSSKSLSYQWLNLTGSIFLLINTAYYGAFPSSFVNVIWIIIAISALYNIISRKM